MNAAETIMPLERVLQSEPLGQIMKPYKGPVPAHHYSSWYKLGNKTRIKVVFNKQK